MLPLLLLSLLIVTGSEPVLVVSVVVVEVEVAEFEEQEIKKVLHLHTLVDGSGECSIKVDEVKASVGDETIASVSSVGLVQVWGRY